MMRCRLTLLAPLLLLLQLCHIPPCTAQMIVLDNETVRTNDSPCAFAPIMGYTSLGALQFDMDSEANRRRAIWNQDLERNTTTVFLETVEYTLCPNQILESGRALVPVVDGAVISCPENCTLTGGGVQVYIETAANGLTTLSSIQLIGWTHQGFSEAAISVVGDNGESNQTTKVKIVNAIFQNYDSENVILLQNKTIDMELTGSTFRAGTSSASTIRNDGTVLHIDESRVTQTISVAGAFVETRNQGTTITSGVTFSGTQNEMVSVFFFDGASTGRMGATAMDGLGVSNTRVQDWSGIVVTGGSVVEVRDWNATNCERLELGMAVTGIGSELTVTRASWLGNTGAFFLDNQPTALLYAENGGTMFANRVQIDANENLRANYFCNNAATMQIVQNCVLGGESVSVGFVSDDSTVTALFDFVNQTNTVSTFCADPAVGRLTVEVSGCFGGQGEDCQTTCRPLATPNQTTDDRGGICLADIPIITNMPSTMPSDTPSSQPTMMPSDSPSSMPSLPPSQVPSMTPSRVASMVPTTSLMPSVSDQPSAVPTSSFQPSASFMPSEEPSSVPSLAPSGAPSTVPSAGPTASAQPTSSHQPTMSPTTSQLPSLDPTNLASAVPTASPQPSVAPSGSTAPSFQPSSVPTPTPTRAPVSPPFRPAPTSSTPAPTDSSSNNMGLIIGIVAGAVGLFVLAGGGYYVYKFRGGRDDGREDNYNYNQQQQYSQPSQPQTYYSTGGGSASAMGDDPSVVSAAQSSARRSHVDPTWTGQRPPATVSYDSQDYSSQDYSSQQPQPPSQYQQQYHQPPRQVYQQQQQQPPQYQPQHAQYAQQPQYQQAPPPQYQQAPPQFQQQQHAPQPPPQQPVQPQNPFDAVSAPAPAPAWTQQGQQPPY